MNVKSIVVAAGLCLLAACATKPGWYQEGKSEEETKRDYAQCRAQVRDKYGSDLQSPHFIADLNTCMELRGYYMKKE